MKIKFALITIAAVLFLTASSAWEGAGAVAPAGELPNEGFFIATNSFPRNTVVDLTNIETGRSTRAIVANTLNSPGLLAIVSREAAELIGMRQGSTSRIRIIQPADPIAYLRFMENSNPSFDPGTPIDEEALLAEVYGEDNYNPTNHSNPTQTAPAQVQSNPEQASPAQTFPVQATNPVTGPSYTMEPEWANSGRMNVVDVPGYDTVPVEQHPRADNAPSQVAAAEPQTNSPPVNEYEGTRVSVIEVRDGYRFEAHLDEREDVIKDVSDRIEEADADNVEKPANEFTDEPPRQLVEKEIFDRETHTAQETRPAYDIRQTTEQPPSSAETNYEIDPNKIIPGIAVARPEQAVQNEATARPVEPVTARPAEPVQQEIYTPRETETAPVAQPPAALPVETETRVTETFPQTEEPSTYVPNTPLPPIVLMPVPTDMLPPSVIEPAVQPSIPSVPAPSHANINSAVRRISQLERGQYYVQIAALPAESVENALRRIDTNYNPGVFSDGGNLHRILIGPLNQGESAAVLARFRSIGYRDAFVRRGS
ncbi:MAG: SPOR domain-containing protein [Treponema sp.]|nr:SPOR domain-containing protein [Treponema sp.]MCL2238079.1 SPOR domain-containing protein [Treponema sp.]